jgi:hypothetical protein
MDGVFGLSRSFHAIGVLAKCTVDVAMLTECVMSPEARHHCLPGA